MRESQDPPSTYRLKIESGEGERNLLLKPGRYSIGRAISNDIVLPLAHVSRKHACLTISEEAGILLEDLGSHNGIHVEGCAFSRGPVEEGARIQVGQTLLWFEKADLGDTDLALHLAPASVSRNFPGVRKSPGARASRVETTTVACGVRSPGEDPKSLQVFENLLDLMAVEGLQWTDPGAASRSLIQPLGARALALVEWMPKAGWVALAVEGDPRPHLEDPSFLGLLESVRRGVSSPGKVAFERRPGDWIAAATARPGAPPLALLMVTAQGQRPSAAVLGLVLRLFDQARPVGALRSRRREALELQFPGDWVLGTSDASRRLYDRLRPLAPSHLPVLLTGETGVGKEQLARALHTSSARCGGPFVAINCAAIPAELQEAELFGIGPGVATDVRGRSGRLQEAHGGTLFLDELGDMPRVLQAKLLRALQEKEIQPLGEAPVAIDVRIVAATNLDLERRVEEGAFRRDLYYRVAGAVVRVPPLRERRDDIPALVEHFLRRFAGDPEVPGGKSIQGLTCKALELLLEYPWPGNVRELRHEMERLVAVCPDGEAIDSKQLADSIRHPMSVPKVPLEGDSLRLATHLEQVERQLILVALERSQGSQRRAAPLLGISRNTLARKIRCLGISAAQG